MTEEKKPAVQNPTCAYDGCQKKVKDKIVNKGGKYCYMHNIWIKMPNTLHRREIFMKSKIESQV